MSDITRRQMLAVGTTGVAGLATAIAVGQAQANTQKPVASQTTTNANGRFANKVVLITGATSGISEGTAYAFDR